MVYWKIKISIWIKTSALQVEANEQSFLIASLWCTRCSRTTACLLEGKPAQLAYYQSENDTALLHDILWMPQVEMYSDTKGDNYPGRPKTDFYSQAGWSQDFNIPW
jgi:hypothetical protein